MQDEPTFDGKAFVANLSSAPGVYRMIAASGDLLYVGKAKARKNRVLNYTQVTRLPRRLQRVVARRTTMS